MIMISRRIPESEIRLECAAAIPSIEVWFKNHPRRKVCHAQGWYDVPVNVRRGHVREDMEAAMAKALER